MAHRSQQLGMQPADVKQRHCRQRGGLQIARHDGLDHLRRSHCREGTDVIDVEKRLADSTLVGQHALGLAAGPGGEQNQGCIFRGQRGRRHCRSAGGDQLQPGGIALPGLAVHHSNAALQRGQVVLHMGKTLRVANQPTGLDVAQT